MNESPNKDFKNMFINKARIFEEKNILKELLKIMSKYDLSKFHKYHWVMVFKTNHT
jgi:hypothetical protein